MDDIEISGRLRELRDRCEDLIVRLRDQNTTFRPVTGALLVDAWRALGQASLEFHIEVGMQKETSESPASGTGIPPDEPEVDVVNLKVRINE